MKFVEPIKDLAIIEELRSVLLHQSYRNYFFFVFATGSGIPCDRMLPLKVSDVKDKDFITIKNIIYDFDESLKQEIAKYIQSMTLDDYLFPSRTKKKSKPITRLMANVFLTEAAQKVGLEKMSFHVLRKTFGWFHFQKHRDINYLQELFGQAAPSVTRKYLGLVDKNGRPVPDPASRI